MPQIILKNTYAELDFKFDLTDWLASGETITVQEVTVTTGITLESTSITGAGKSVTYWLSGGTNGSIYTATLKFTTSAGRKDTRYMTISVQVNNG